MLETLRQMTKSWIMKTILGLLALTFVVFFGSTNFGGGRGGSGKRLPAPLATMRPLPGRRRQPGYR